MNETGALIKQTPESCLARFLPCEDTVKAQQAAAQKRALTGTWPCWHPDIELSFSRTMKYIYKLLCIAVWAEWGTKPPQLSWPMICCSIRQFIIALPTRSANGGRMPCHGVCEVWLFDLSPQYEHFLPNITFLRVNLIRYDKKTPTGNLRRAQEWHVRQAGTCWEESPGPWIRSSLCLGFPTHCDSLSHSSPSWALGSCLHNEGCQPWDQKSLSRLEFTMMRDTHAHVNYSVPLQWCSLTLR